METILSAEGPSEKVRNAAFALLVTMGWKMKDVSHPMYVPDISGIIPLWI
jgi:hypothetical protein